MRPGRVSQLGSATWLLLSFAVLCGANDVASKESTEALFEYAGIDNVVVSPNGQWIAAAAHRGDEWTVLIQRIGHEKTTELVRSKAIGIFAWEAPDTLIYEAESASGVWQTRVVRLRFVNGVIAVDGHRLFGSGGLVDPLPTIPEVVLWQIRYRGQSILYRVSLQELIDNDKPGGSDLTSIKLADKLATLTGIARRWIIDQDGKPRAALREYDGGWALMMPSRLTGAFETVERWKDLEGTREILPVGLTAQGSRLIVSAYQGKNTRGLYEFDAKTREVGRPIFVHDEFDVRGVLTDRLTGDLVAAVYDEGGEARFHYFDAFRDRFLAKLPAEWRRESVQVLSGTLDRQVFVLREADATEPGTFYIRDRAGRIKPIGRSGENVDRTKLSRVETFKVKSSDGIEVEAYLTLPRDVSKPAPLLVMPHGGPFNVRDSRQYDPFVQYFASWGFAVLQMNFRGSTGYGLDFEMRVKKQWARGIEDDIDAAVEHAMALPGVDSTRICIVGGSYGGFSALASVIRHRDRYRCAVSIAGVTDIPLMLESSDSSDSKDYVAFFKEYIGDPEENRDALLEISPAYHVDAIEVPVLIIQGTRDRRVDPDHAHRLALMLELYGKEFEMLEIEKAGHGFDRDEWIIVARSVRRFVSGYLMPGEPFEPDPSVALGP